MRITSIVLLFITSLNALAAGYSFISDPSGKGLGISVEYLEYSPFTNFLIPGIVLFIAIGILSAFVAIAAIIKNKNYPKFILIQGFMIVGWIVIQIMMVRDFNILHFAILSIGIILIYLSRRILNKVKPYYPLTF